MKRLITLLLVLTMNATTASEPLPLWPANPPDGIRLDPEDESIDDRTTPGRGLSRGFWHIHQPTLTLMPAPEARATGVACLVLPGGGYRYLEMDKEGYDIGRWLNTIGVTAIVVKYRTRPIPTPEEQWPNVMAATLNDAERAMRLTRHHATEWGIDPNRIGAMGFSAGGSLATSLAINSDTGNPKATDPVERLSSRPNYLGLIYPSARFLPDSTSVLPPVFIANAGDDPKTPPQGAVKLYAAFLELGVPVELHIFREGNHGFGLGSRGGSVRNWTHLFEEWLRDLHLLDVQPVTKGVPSRDEIPRGN